MSATRIEPKTIPIRRQAKAPPPGASMPTRAALVALPLACPVVEVVTRSCPLSSDWAWLETSMAMAVAGPGSSVLSKVAKPERLSPSGWMVQITGLPLAASVPDA